MELEIPKYLSIKNYQKVNSLEHLSSTEKTVEVLAILGDIPSEQLKKKHSKDLPKMYDKVTEALFDVGYEYYPIIEVEGVLYGYQPITKMTLGEYIDLENLTKKPLENLDQIMAILYRPVLKHRFKSLEFKIKNGLRLGQGKLEDVLKYYTVEEYDSNKRYDYAEIFQDIPVAYALGALSFFFANRKHTLERYRDLFVQNQNPEGEEGDAESDGQTTFSEHWGWLVTIYHLASTPILSVTGDKSITAVNFIGVLNYLAYEKDKTRQDEQRRKLLEQQRSYRIK